MKIHRVCAAAAATLALGLLLYAYDPATTALFPSCPFRMLTGLLCPLCGTLRAAHALLHAEVVDAFWFNPLTFTSGAAWLFALGVAPELTLGPTTAALKLGPTTAALVSAVGPSVSSGVLLRWLAAAGVVIFTFARNVDWWAWWAW